MMRARDIGTLRVTAPLVAAAATVAFGTVACSLLVDTDGFADPAPTNAALADAATPPDGDAATPPDGDAATPPDGDAAAPPFCASNQGHTACFDFDDPSRSLPLPLESSASAGATLEIEPGTFRSAPHALHCVVPTSPGGRARAGYRLLTTPRNISLSFSMYVASAPLTRATLIHLNLYGPTGFWQTGLWTATNGSTFDVFEYGEDNQTITASDDVPIVPQTTGKWLRVRVSIHLDEGGVSSTEIDVDGTKRSKPLTLPPWVASAVNPSLLLGIAHLDNQPLADLYLDDILIDVQ